MNDNEIGIKRNFRIGPQDRWARKKTGALYATVLSGSFGALLFAYVGHLLLPDWLVEIGFVGFIAGVATYVALASRFAKRVSKDEYSQGNSRTEDEVRKALADLQAKKT